MTTSTYQPKPGSIAWKVIEFLTTNPDEELTTQDVGAKFDCPRLSVHSCLGLAVNSGVLSRVEAPYGELVYRLGTTECDAVRSALSGADEPPATPPPARRKSRRVVVDFDADAVVLRDDVPLPPRWRPVGSKLEPLLERMEVGQSQVFPLEISGSLKMACADLKKKTGKALTVRRLSETEIGVWRLE